MNNPVKNPILITSLEEDFKKIGLIKASDISESAAVETETDDASEDNMDEARIKVALRGGKKVRQQKTSAKQRRMAKKYRKSAAGKKAMRMRARKMKKPSMQRRMKRLAAKAQRLGTRKESVEQVAENFDMAEALKSFANSAIIAEKLSAFFDSYVESFIDEDETELAEAVEESADTLSDIAGTCEELAEAFAELAEALHEGKKAEGMTAFFNEGLDFILDAVDLYEAMQDSEDEEMDSEDEEEESDEGEE